jgi:hypothetical protein
LNTGRFAHHATERGEPDRPVKACARYHGRLVAGVYYHPVVAAVHRAFHDPLDTHAHPPGERKMEHFHVAFAWPAFPAVRASGLGWVMRRLDCVVVTT